MLEERTWMETLVHGDPDAPTYWYYLGESSWQAGLINAVLLYFTYLVLVATSLGQKYVQPYIDMAMTQYTSYAHPYVDMGLDTLPVDVRYWWNELTHRE